MPIVAGKEYPYTPEGIAAAQLAQAGRNEDNALLGGEVAHISAAEADLLRSRGGAGTINPVTGLREYGGVGTGAGTASPGPGSMGSLGLGVTGQGQSSTSPAQAPTSIAGFSQGLLPPGFGPLGYPGAISVHPAVANQFPGRSLGEKISLYQEKLRSRQGEPVQPFISPTPTPSVALADLPGSAALSSSSLDPFLFSPTSAPASSALGDVLVPYNPDLGTVPIGEQAPVTVAAGTDPNIFSAQVEEPTTFSQGGAAMAGLGFRPLGYSTGTGPTGVEDDYIGNVISEFNKLYSSNQIFPDVIDLVKNNPKVFFARDLDPRVANIIRYLVAEGHVKRPPTAKEITAETEAFEASQAQDPESPIGAVGMPSPWNMGFVADSTVSRGELDYVDPGPWYQTGGRLEDVGTESNLNLGRIAGAGAGMDSTYPVEETVTETESMTGYPGLQAGGHVGRGTMAGELGGRGDLSVRQAGETMQERWKRMHGYAGGGYASRGTVAGELPRYGHMSVREEGESMGELAKRHRDQDWYNRMGRGLGSLRRRMA